MKFKRACPVFVFAVLALFTLQAFAQDTDLNGLLNGKYGFTESLICMQAKRDQDGMHPPLPHFTEIQPGVYQLLVPGEGANFAISGVVEFDGIGSVTQSGSAMSIDVTATNSGDVVGTPFPPMECEGDYSVGADRSIVMSDYTCIQQIPGDPPLTGELGPLEYRGYVSPDGQVIVASIATPLKASANVKLPDGTIIDEYEGVCISSQTLIKIENDPVYFAQFANGGGITSEIVLANPSTSLQVAGSVHFRDDNGNELPVGISGQSEAVSQVDFTLSPTGSTTIKTDGQGSVKVGSATASSGSDLSGVVRFNLPGIGVSGVGQSASLSGFIFPAQNQTGGVSTGFAVQNTSSNPVTIQLSLRDQDGTVVSEATLEDLAANGHMAKYITEVFTDVDLSAFQGVVVGRVHNGKVSATALELDAASGTFTTLPVSPLN